MTKQAINTSGGSDTKQEKLEPHEDPNLFIVGGLVHRPLMIFDQPHNNSDLEYTKPAISFNKYSQSFKQGSASYMMKVERLKQLPSLKMKSMDL